MNKNKLCTSIRINYSYRTLNIAYLWVFFGLFGYFLRNLAKPAKKALKSILIILIELFLFIGPPCNKKMQQ